MYLNAWIRFEVDVNFVKVLIVDITDQPLEGGPPTAEAARVRLGKNLCKGEVRILTSIPANSLES